MLARHLLSRATWMRHRLATQLVALIVLVALMSGGTVGLLVVDRARLALRDEILRSSLAEADLAANLATAYITDTEGDVRDLAASLEVRAAATNQDFRATSPVLERWLSQHPNLVSVSLADATGVVRATGLSDKTNVDFQQVADRDWFQGALTSGQPFLGAAKESTLTHRPIVPYGVPVLNGNGSLQAMLVGSISLEALSNSLTIIQVGPNARISLIDIAQHVILAHPDPSRILTQTSGHNPGKNEATRQLETGQRGALESVNSSGDKTLAAFTPVPGLAWGVLIQQPSTEAFAPVDDMLRQVISLIAVGLLVAGGVGVGLAVGIIRPVRQLRTVLDAMAKGELGQRVRTTRQDELGELGHGFDRMADQLQQTLSDLQEGEARFRGIISAAFDGYAIHQHGRILEASEAFATLFGYDQHELVGQSVLNLAAPESRALVTEHITSAAEAPYECVGVKRDEKRFYMELVDNACLFEGRPARAIAVRDVTPRRQAEEQRSRMAAIVDASSEAIVGFAKDANVTGWNRGAEHIFGYSADDMVGHSIAHLVPPDGLAEYIETGQRLMRGEGIQSLETVRVRQDGTRIEVSLSISVVRDGLGQVVGAAMVAHDITERKRAEAALQESERRYRRLVELSPQAIMVHDGGTILYANVAAARLAGVPDPADLLGSSLWDLVHPDDRETLRQRLAALPRTPDIDSLFEARLVQRTGEVLDTEISTIPTTYGGQPAYQAIVNDITPRKTAEKQAHILAQAEKLRALGQMASGIAHDLNQSLMLVSSYSDLAKRELDRDSIDRNEIRELLSTATQAALDGGESVKRLLLFTRQVPEREGQPVELTALVREVAQLTAPRWRDTPQVEGRPISLYVEAIGSPIILGSAQRLREALTNLIFNAVDALPRGGVIRMAVGIEDDRAVIRVTDSGLGMTPEVQARIFEPFYTTKGGSGTGLGLAMVFGIVEQHRGSIVVQSTPGVSTTFRLSFPLVDVESIETLPPILAVTPISVQRLRLLAVDDEPAMTKAVVRMLRPAGHQVSTASSGEEALERLSAETFDVVLSDMGMGAGMNGWELAAAVKERWPSVRFLLATGWGAAIDPVEAREKGVEAILAKPYRPIDLEQALANRPGLAA